MGRFYRREETNILQGVFAVLKNVVFVKAKQFFSVIIKILPLFFSETKCGEQNYFVVYFCAI